MISELQVPPVCRAQEGAAQPADGRAGVPPGRAAVRQRAVHQQGALLRRAGRLPGRLRRERLRSGPGETRH